MNTNSNKHTQLQKGIDNLEFRGTCDGNRIAYVYDNKEELTHHLKFHANESDKSIEFLRQC